jgi:hypothetical protein
VFWDKCTHKWTLSLNPPLKVPLFHKPTLHLSAQQAQGRTFHSTSGFDKHDSIHTIVDVGGVTKLTVDLLIVLSLNALLDMISMSLEKKGRFIHSIKNEMLHAAS